MGRRIRKGPQREEEGGHSADVGETKEYMIPKGKHVSVHEGDFVKAGEA